MYDVTLHVFIIAERKVHPSMSEGKQYFVFNGLNQAKTWLRSYSWIGVQRLVRLVVSLGRIDCYLAHN